MIPIICLDNDSELTIHARLKQKILELISTGVFHVGYKMPSTRNLAKDLNIARNTVVSVYDELVDEGILQSRARSGIYVSLAIESSIHSSPSQLSSPHSKVNWTRRTRYLPIEASDDGGVNASYRYDFRPRSPAYNLFPQREWRAAVNSAMSVNSTEQWATLDPSTDDQRLVQALISHVLPRRGIIAREQEVLITTGTSHSLSLIAQLLCTEQVDITMEEPGNPDFRALVSGFGARKRYLNVDSSGLEIDEYALSKTDVLYLTPSHQVPTGITMSEERRKEILEIANRYDIIVIEDDIHRELNFRTSPQRALKSFDVEGRVIHLGGFSEALNNSVQIGYIVGAPNVIRRLKELRNYLQAYPAPMSQRILANFINAGSLDLLEKRVSETYSERWFALRDALNHYLHDWIKTSPVMGGAFFWVQLPNFIDAETFYSSMSLAKVGVEDASRFFTTQNTGLILRMGVSSLDPTEIREGVRQLADALKAIPNAWDERATPQTPLTPKELVTAISNMTVQYKTVYGDVCKIQFLEDGTMVGKSGTLGDDNDQGTWWIESNLWWRKWNRWAYGEAKAYQVAIDGDQLLWLDDTGYVLDRAQIIRQSASKSSLDHKQTKSGSVPSI